MTKPITSSTVAAIDPLKYFKGSMVATHTDRPTELVVTEYSVKSCVARMVTVNDVGLHRRDCNVIVQRVSEKKHPLILSAIS